MTGKIVLAASPALRIISDAPVTTFTISVLKISLEISSLLPLLGAYFTLLRTSDFLQLFIARR